MSGIVGSLGWVLVIVDQCLRTEIKQYIYTSIVCTWFQGHIYNPVYCKINYRDDRGYPPFHCIFIEWLSKMLKVSWRLCCFSAPFLICSLWALIILDLPIDVSSPPSCLINPESSRLKVISRCREGYCFTEVVKSVGRAGRLLCCNSPVPIKLREVWYCIFNSDKISCSQPLFSNNWGYWITVGKFYLQFIH